MTSKDQRGNRGTLNNRALGRENLVFYQNMYTTLTRLRKKSHMEDPNENKLPDQETMHKQFRP